MDYEQFKIKVYDNWDLFLDMNQFPYIGRCYAWAKREEADTVLDMNLDERKELFDDVIPSWKNAITKLYGDFRPNIAILGNETPHLHVHLVPRQINVKLFDIEFNDPNPKGNYAPYEKKEIPIETILRIKNDIKRII